MNPMPQSFEAPTVAFAVLVLIFINWFAVVLAWVALERFSPRKSHSPLRPPSGDLPQPSFGPPVM